MSQNLYYPPIAVEREPAVDNPIFLQSDYTTDYPLSDIPPSCRTLFPKHSLTLDNLNKKCPKNGLK